MTTDADAEPDPELRALDSATVAEIAAGEVVTRPAAAVKELLENSLDAGASAVAVDVEGDGTPLLRVRDDGHGMSEAAVELAVDRHTTSKIRDADDIRRVETLGFRGEALPSIASAAGRLDVITNDGGARGTLLRIEDGEKTTAPAGRGVGTTVEVRELFRDRPARRKSLASAKAEFARVSRVVTRYALARPDVRVSLSHDGRETFSTPGTGSYADALLGAYDRTVAAESTEFDHEATVDGVAVAVSGVLSYPSVTRARRDHVYTVVNGRAVSDDRLRAAVVRGYGSLLPDGRAPVAVVAVSVAPELVDPNVHPAKEEVGLTDAEALTDAVETAVADALSTADLRRSAEVATDLEGTLTTVSRESAFDDVTVIGQFRDLYLLCEEGEDLLVVDQHAAHERVNFERLRAAVADEGIESAPLDPPATLELSASEAALAEAHADTLSTLGYDVAAFGGTTVRVGGVPAPLGRVAAPASLRDVLAGLETGDAPTPADLREEVLAELACHPSLKAGESLSTAEAEELLDRLGACEQPYACPHGRPTVLAVEEAALARGFDRGNTRL